MLRRAADRRVPSLLEGGRFALGVIVGISIAVLIVLGLQALGTSFSRSEAIQLLTALPALFVALVSFVISYQALSEQKRMRQAGTDPVVLAHLAPRDDEPMMVMLRISNVGAGAAMNVRFRADIEPQELQRKECLVAFEKVDRPIRVIPQNASVSYNLGLGFNLLKDEPLRPFDVMLEYEDIDGVEYSSRQAVDVRELAYQNASSPPITTMSKSLEKISKSIKEIGGVISEIRSVSPLPNSTTSDTSFRRG